MRNVRVVVAILLAVLVACGSSEDLGGPKLAHDPAVLQSTSAQAMADVTSVRFTLERTGAPVYIDQVESIALDGIEGRFSVPGSADAILRVTVNDSLGTKLGAVAIDDEVWLSNPVTGKFETLPPGFDIDPSLFFDPKGGWQPLIEGLTDVVFVAEEQREGTRYRLTGVAPAERMQAITAGLVRGQDVELDLWLHPATAAVTAVEFSTVFDGAQSDWVLELLDYGEDFTIEPPAE